VRELISLGVNNALRWPDVDVGIVVDCRKLVHHLERVIRSS